MVFIGILHLQSGEMSGFDGTQMGVCTLNDNAALRHEIYAREDEMARGKRESSRP
jgi:hypothetical protein